MLTQAEVNAAVGTMLQSFVDADNKSDAAGVAAIYKYPLAVYPDGSTFSEVKSIDSASALQSDLLADWGRMSYHQMEITNPASFIKGPSISGMTATGTVIYDFNYSFTTSETSGCNQLQAQDEISILADGTVQVTSHMTRMWGKC